ncbi:ADP-glyceromanno-heptose 6-epimerase [bacterium]|nr:ADP-glyceromanno-heptose 6-epimerase [bacterium]
MIIVTGGAGFIGSAVVWKLNQRGEFNILVVDELGKSGKWKNLRGLRFMDYMDKDIFLEKVLKGDFKTGVCALIHMGACSDTTEQDADYLLLNNYEYTKHLAAYAAKRNARFIYASSAATYGDGSYGYSDDEKDLYKFCPLNMYAYSKHLFDLWAERNGLLKQAAGLKFFNVFGPNEYHKGEMRSMVIKAFEQIKNGRGQACLSLFKSHKSEYAHGEQKRDFLYIKDAVEMTLFFLDNPDVNGIFNIGTGRAETWNKLAELIFEALKIEPDIKYIPMPESIKDSYQYFTQADISKFRHAGYRRPITSLKKAVFDYVQNYLELQLTLTLS